MQDIFHKMEEKVAKIIEKLEKIGKRCANLPNLVDESMVGREVNDDMLELLNEDELGTRKGRPCNNNQINILKCVKIFTCYTYI